MDILSNLVGAGFEAARTSKMAEVETAAQTAARLKNEQQIKDTALSFEQMFLSQMLQHMNEGIEPDSMFGGGHSEKMFQSLMNDEYAKEITKRGGIGVADAVERYLLQLQEV